MYLFSYIITFVLFLVRYGYVSPDDVSLLLEEHISKGKIVDRLWRYHFYFSYLLNEVLTCDHRS